MGLRVLRYFLAGVQAESISGAAENLTLPALSRQFMDLEISPGTKLFRRRHRGPFSKVFTRYRFLL